MPKKFPAEVHDRAVRMVLDLLSDYPTVFAACSALAPKLNVGVETLRKTETAAATMKRTQIMAEKKPAANSVPPKVAPRKEPKVNLIKAEGGQKKS